MPTQDTSQIKEKIILTIKKRGPSLPVHIAKETGMSILFTSAFLSELLSEKKIKISNMKVGSSPIYFIQGQEPMIEKFAEHLKSREKDAFNLLKEKKFLRDDEQEPAIRVALRSIKDFAVPFKKEDKVFWRYFTIPESELELKKPEIEKIEKKQQETSPKKENELKEKKGEELNIFDKEKIKEGKSGQKGRKRQLKKPAKKKNEKFFNKVKEFLSKKSIEISDIEGFSKSNLILKVRYSGKEQLLVAYNKKRINEADLIKANKKALEMGLPYITLSLGDAPKKLNEMIGAVRNLSEMHKLE